MVDPHETGGDAGGGDFVPVDAAKGDTLRVRVAPAESRDGSAAPGSSVGMVLGSFGKEHAYPSLIGCPPVSPAREHAPIEGRTIGA